MKLKAKKAKGWSYYFHNDIIEEEKDIYNIDCLEDEDFEAWEQGFMQGYVNA